MGHGPQLCAGRRRRPHYPREPARPAAAARLKELGADVVTVDLTSDAGRAKMEDLLAATAAGLPTRHGLREPDAILGGATPYYAVYPVAEGRDAVGALEPHFAETLRAELDLPEGTGDDVAAALGDDVAAALGAALQSRSARDWQAWREERGIPLAEVGRGLCDTSDTRLPV
ncbi:hypothetical protein [Micrococcus luteus]|uniref:hypothetical protein n=1 Tax=Micrococcus luteus TaxID=1270 RepID=UPI0021B22630|nr:hypothetical protein [Micrococcus luteus]